MLRSLRESEDMQSEAAGLPAAVLRRDANSAARSGHTADQRREMLVREWRTLSESVLQAAEAADLDAEQWTWGDGGKDSDSESSEPRETAPPDAAATRAYLSSPASTHSDLGRLMVDILAAEIAIDPMKLADCVAGMLSLLLSTSAERQKRQKRHA